MIFLIITFVDCITFWKYFEQLKDEDEDGLHKKGFCPEGEKVGEVSFNKLRLSVDLKCFVFSGNRRHYIL